jgi:hypothetical protein
MDWKWLSINKTFCFLLQCWKIIALILINFLAEIMGIFQRKFDFLFKSFDGFDNLFRRNFL